VVYACLPRSTGQSKGNRGKDLLKKKKKGKKKISADEDRREGKKGAKEKRSTRGGEGVKAWIGKKRTRDQEEKER